MPNTVVVDAGPLIALFDRDDRHHGRAVEFVREFPGDLVTNHAVVTEVTHLLDFSAEAQADFLRWVLDGGVAVAAITPDDLRYVVELIRKYSDLPLDFADGTLVALCERLRTRDVASVDRHFDVYRTRDRKSLRNVFLG